jgi:hypothetical protein
MPAKILEAAGAMSWPMWPALNPDDSLLVPSAPPEGFSTYLKALGLRAPHFVVDPTAARPAPPNTSSVEHSVAQAFNGMTLTPFGWNAAAAERRVAWGCNGEHPAPDVVRRVNSRAFSHELERSLFGESAFPSVLYNTQREVKAWLQNAEPGEYVAKGNHGHAGIGQVRFTVERRAGASVALASALLRAAARHDGLVIEAKAHVVCEWGVLFRVGKNGEISALRIHRLHSGPTGGYEGALVLPPGEALQDELWQAHAVQARAACEAVAQELHTHGYFGPVGLDMFAHEQQGEIKFRALVDLNARGSMAWPAHGLAARFPGCAILFRQMPASSLKVPTGYPELSDLCDNLSFNPEHGRGAIWVTPLLHLARVSFALVGVDAADVVRMNDELMTRMAR